MVKVVRTDPPPTFKEAWATLGQLAYVIIMRLITENWPTLGFKTHIFNESFRINLYLLGTRFYVLNIAPQFLFRRQILAFGLD